MVCVPLLKRRATAGSEPPSGLCGFHLALCMLAGAPEDWGNQQARILSLVQGPPRNSLLPRGEKQLRPQASLGDCAQGERRLDRGPGEGTSRLWSACPPGAGSECPPVGPMRTSTVKMGCTALARQRGSGRLSPSAVTPSSGPGSGDRAAPEPALSSSSMSHSLACRAAGGSRVAARGRFMKEWRDDWRVAAVPTRSAWPARGLCLHVALSVPPLSTWACVVV